MYWIICQCDNCKKTFHETVYTKDFVFYDKVECPDCRIIHGEDVTGQLLLPKAICKISEWNP